MTEIKFYSFDVCPFCGGDLREAGNSKRGNLILICIECGEMMLEDYIDKIKEEK